MVEKIIKFPGEYDPDDREPETGENKNEAVYDLGTYRRIMEGAKSRDLHPTMQEATLRAKEAVIFFEIWDEIHDILEKLSLGDYEPKFSKCYEEIAGLSDTEIKNWLIAQDKSIIMKDPILAAAYAITAVKRKIFP